MDSRPRPTLSMILLGRLRSVTPKEAPGLIKSRRAREETKRYVDAQDTSILGLNISHIYM